jgi:tripartite-type tricarboxylate transporter receptor subunit TctC
MGNSGMLRVVCAAALGLLAPVLVSHAAAQAFPARPIEVVIHTSAGGGTDTTARMMAAGLQTAIKGNAVVVQKPGGGGLVSINYVRLKPRDGHTVLAITPTHLFALARRLSPLTIDDIVGVARSADDPLVVVVNAKGAMKTLDDLVARGKTTPIKWGTTQIGGIDHVAAAVFARRAATQIAVVPFDGGGEIVTNLLGNNIEAAGLNLTEGLALIQRGDFRPLAVMSAQRLAMLPEVPTLVERGFPVQFSTVRGYVVLKGTPPDRIAALERAMVTGMKDTAYQAFLQRSGLGPESVAGAREWDAQIRQMFDVARAAMTELGMIK